MSRPFLVKERIKRETWLMSRDKNNDVFVCLKKWDSY